MITPELYREIVDGRGPEYAVAGEAEVRERYSALSARLSKAIRSHTSPEDAVMDIFRTPQTGFRKSAGEVSGAEQWNLNALYLLTDEIVSDDNFPTRVKLLALEKLQRRSQYSGNPHIPIDEINRYIAEKRHGLTQTTRQKAEKSGLRLV